MITKSDLFRAYFDAATDPMVVVDAANGTIVDANDQALTDTGRTRDAIVGLLLDCVLRAPVRLLTRSLEGSGGTIEGVELLAKTGHSIAVEASSTPVRLDDGHYFFVVFRRTGSGDSRTESPDAAAGSSASHGFPGIVGKSEQIRHVCRLIGSVATTDATVLIQGESGTGKEVVADAIHALSRRRGAPFVRVNCAALPETLLESELFGHVKGAFTGAIRDRRGRFKQADGGTILLDEIGSMPLSGQATLLRVLQERAYEPVGSSQTVPVDVRVIAATNSDLDKSVAAGSFRADLYYRLNVFGIPLPSLRERADDIPLLAHHFLRHYADALGKRIRSLAPDTIAALSAYPWPGNVRELENAIEHATIVETSPVLLLSSLPAPVAKMATPAAPDDSCILGLRERLTIAERQILVDTLRRANGIKKRAAEMLGIDSRNMPYFLRKHRLQEHC